MRKWKQRKNQLFLVVVSFWLNVWESVFVGTFLCFYGGGKVGFTVTAKLTLEN